MDDKVTISKSEYMNLLIRNEKLACLEKAGLDNWRVYGCNCEHTGEDECIFCCEDEEEFIKEHR